MKQTVFRRACGFALICFAVGAVTVAPQRATKNHATKSSFAPKINVAHRGASAYAPEHTLAAYELAIEQGADYVEQDLQVTKDGVLVCLHDTTLERTTNVEDVFPSRFTEETTGAAKVKRWHVTDFTVAEIKRLDAGSWFDPKFKGAQVPTWAEAIRSIRGRAGLYPETKAPEVYGRRGFEMERLVLDELKRHKLDRPGADRRTPIIIQSFSAASLRKMKELEIRLPLVLLVGAEGRDEWLTPAGLRRAREFAAGIGPAKSLVTAELVRAAHDLRLTVTPYTFRSAAGGSGDVRAEMRRFLYDLGCDGVFTDNPDMFPR